jgi:hypothetical protein
VLACARPRDELEFCIGFMWKCRHLWSYWTYRSFSYSFRGNYSFLNLEIVANSSSCRNISIFYLINWILAAETIHGQKLYEEIQYISLHNWNSYYFLIHVFEFKYFYNFTKKIFPFFEIIDIIAFKSWWTSKVHKE